MSTPVGGSLNTDFDLMTAVAGKIGSRNDELRAMLQSFIGRMSSVPPSVWGGVAATRFRDVVDRWNAESNRLHVALEGIAETMRLNERTLREAADSHSHQIGAVGATIEGA
ncbi:WXG100 family type VII secretion target [Mycobacterium sp. 1274761.0]|uniref:WXG100 family type VII secretion target n=1 Tax=Mycobacterium sp. 1274761.0 TaxID=1834077 RepID=UPI000800B470|nr:WXG100 family type VII secretion target [Mycobacterium sp. 1274761.0]OBK70465.1 type VII secretion protein EsxU [Mycobacterium sp. 1274761.0]